MWAGEQINEKYQNGCHLKTISQNNKKSNDHILEACVHVHVKDEVSVTNVPQVMLLTRLNMNAIKYYVNYKLKINKLKFNFSVCI